ncbi:MAG: hypothetical protein J6Y91_01600, partial [Alphaproteobacteria bacterium]|nr:hypothetical protein [Alphaproteobacteria bacterium]
MKRIAILMSLMCLLSLQPAQAYLRGVAQGQEKPVHIVVPHLHIVKESNRIYTPDKYHCYMRKTLKYCHDNKGRPLNGRIVNTYKDRVAYEVYRDGYQNGTTSIFDESGTLLERVDYKKGIRDGEALIYYYNGNIEFVMHYRDGALNGRVEQYDINGALIGKMTYKKGWFKEGYCKN